MYVLKIAPWHAKVQCEQSCGGEIDNHLCNDDFLIFVGFDIDGGSAVFRHTPQCLIDAVFD